MLNPHDRNRLLAVTKMAPPGPAIVVASGRDDGALDVAAVLLAAGRRRVMAYGPFDPVQLRGALTRPELFGRVQAIIGAPVSLSSHHRLPATLICLHAGGLSPAGLKAYGNGWARHLQAGGYLALWGGSAPSLAALGVTPTYWEGWPEGRPLELLRRKPVG